MSKRIYILDDDEFDADLCIRAIKRYDNSHTVQWFKDSIKLEAALEEKPLADLIILDLKMPGFSGDQVIARLKSRHKENCPLLLTFSSSDLMTDRKRAIEAGAAEYYVKPMKLSEYRNTVSSMLSRWLRSKD